MTMFKILLGIICASLSVSCLVLTILGLKYIWYEADKYFKENAKDKL